jgi:hypothetical protein
MQKTPPKKCFLPLLPQLTSILHVAEAPPKTCVPGFTERA